MVPFTLLCLLFATLYIPVELQPPHVHCSAKDGGLGDGCDCYQFIVEENTDQNVIVNCTPSFSIATRLLDINVEYSCSDKRGQTINSGGITVFSGKTSNPFYNESVVNCSFLISYWNNDYDKRKMKEPQYCCFTHNIIEPSSSGTVSTSLVTSTANFSSSLVFSVTSISSMSSLNTNSEGPTHSSSFIRDATSTVHTSSQINTTAESSGTRLLGHTQDFSLLLVASVIISCTLFCVSALSSLVVLMSIMKRKEKITIIPEGLDMVLESQLYQKDKPMPKQAPQETKLCQHSQPESNDKTEEIIIVKTATNCEANLEAAVSQQVTLCLKEQIGDTDIQNNGCSKEIDSCTSKIALGPGKSPSFKCRSHSSIFGYQYPSDSFFPFSQTVATESSEKHKGRHSSDNDPHLITDNCSTDGYRPFLSEPSLCSSYIYQTSDNYSADVDDSLDQKSDTYIYFGVANGEGRGNNCICDHNVSSGKSPSDKVYSMKGCVLDLSKESILKDLAKEAETSKIDHQMKAVDDGYLCM